VHIIPKWIVKKEKIDGKVWYSIYRRWLWMTKFYGRFSTKDEALNKLQAILNRKILQES
jgi:hypothetical protein